MEIEFLIDAEFCEKPSSLEVEVDVNSTLRYLFLQNVDVAHIRGFVELYPIDDFKVNWIPEGEDFGLIHLALANDNEEQFELLFDMFGQTIDPNLKTRLTGYTPLHLILHTFAADREVLFQTIQQHGELDWNVKNKEGQTALKMAQILGMPWEFSYILQQEGVMSTEEDFIWALGDMEFGGDEEWEQICEITQDFLIKKFLY